MNMITPRTKAFERLIWATDMVLLLSKGVSISEACSLLGVSRATYYRRYHNDEIFRHQINRARQSVSAELLSVVRRSGEWRAAAWILEKRYPSDYGTVKDRLRLARCSCGAASAIMR